MSRGMWMLFTLIGFAMGGIMYGRILPEKLAHTNVCALSPDHNPGAANVFTYCGWKMGLMCLALDMGKGFLPVFIACRLSGGDFTNPMIAPLMLAPVLGHALAPFSPLPEVWWERLSKLVGMGLYTVFNYFGQRFFAFRRPKVHS